MKQSPEFTVKISEDLLKKLILVANSEKRSLNNQILFMIRNNIQYYEKTKGRISAENLKNIDISEYICEEDEN